jgi:hypothetical protein
MSQPFASPPLFVGGFAPRSNKLFFNATDLLSSEIDSFFFAALAVPPLLAAMGYEQAKGGWKLRNGARNFY